MSSDEFDAYDFSEFTAQDLLDVDARLAQRGSPLNTFFPHKTFLGVTDLVGPIWCEVQYEYSLYGGRNKPIHLRPAAFAAKSGKQISVHQHVARTNDRRLKRGRSVHKALEDELQPDKLVAHPTSEEERFGLRLVQLIDGFAQLVTNGITRELPVFTITHQRVVFGIIDEVLCSPVPASPPHKKQRTLQHASSIHSPSTDQFELCILDHKTRRFPSIPVDQDSLSTRLQLMMYHRMLSSLLRPQDFDFDLLWARLKLDPTKPFSQPFLDDISWQQRNTDPTNCSLHLNRLVSVWTAAVQRQRPNMLGVSPHLQLVYRRSPSAKLPVNQYHKTPSIPDIEDPLQAIVLQQGFDRDLARAIEQSLRDMGHSHASQLARHIAQHVLQVGPSSIGRTSAVWKDIVMPSDSEQFDPILAWVIQESLLTYARKVYQVPADRLRQTDAKQDVPETKSQSSSDVHVTADDISPVIGKKEFSMDDRELDTHLTDVLQWWLGLRPARGVDIGQTNRCFTCEYQDSCEWRERKAKEALAHTSERRQQ